ncbi:hypothetical protein PN36_32010 [Candidatus Thiomargarita nelsonii]|uniref:Uncharacterized protein n=1 Tax=Candidatus Thiomargarita nelsonii TaxID=1003181 RepID=A0A4E0QJX4_9GAMM|nr:hypothetical protein PN36_32010 [Candidatus Thiomargarita nelsonii]
MWLPWVYYYLGVALWLINKYKKKAKQSKAKQSKAKQHHIISPHHAINFFLTRKREPTTTYIR